MMNTEISAEIATAYDEVLKSVFYHQNEPWLCILSSTQKMFLMNQLVISNTYQVSTALNGLGCLNGSLKTPIGLHYITDKIGHGTEKNKIFKARKETDDYADIINEAKSSNKDLITSRVLRLGGLEFAKNVGEGVDSYQRYIYIHGTNEEGLIGKTVSHGCIRMKNNDVIQLFDTISEQSLVYIC